MVLVHKGLGGKVSQVCLFIFNLFTKIKQLRGRKENPSSNVGCAFRRTQTDIQHSVAFVQGKRSTSTLAEVGIIGLCAGQSSSSTPISTNHFCMDLTLCMGLLSCWNRKGLPLTLKISLGTGPSPNYYSSSIQLYSWH